MAKEVKKNIEVKDKTKTEVVDTVKDTKQVDTNKVKEEQKVAEQTKKDTNNKEKAQPDESKKENTEDSSINIEKIETPTESKCTPNKRVRMGFGYLNGWNGMEY